jgi:hypothetical protein
MASASNLLGRGTTVKNEATQAANSANRIGTLIIDIIRSVAMAYDASMAYVSGQPIIWTGFYAVALEDTTAGQSPTSHPAKWQVMAVTSAEGIAENGSKLPVSADAVAAKIAQIQNSNNQGVSIGNFTTPGIYRRGTKEEGELFAAADVEPGLDLNVVLAPAELFPLIRRMIQSSEIFPGIDDTIRNNPVSGRTPILGGLKLTGLQTTDNPKYVVVAVDQPDGSKCLMITEADSIAPLPEPPTVPDNITDQQYVVGVPFTYQIPPFPGATRYVLTIPPTGFTRDEVNRVIAGTSSKLGETIVRITAINTGGEVSVDILFTGIPAPVPQLITDLYWADNNSGSNLSLYLFGNGEPDGINYEILDPDDDSVIISERKFSYDPGKYDREGLFHGFAPYTALLFGLSVATDYKIRAWVEGSTNVIEQVFTYTSAGRGKIYPVITDILAFKPATASTNNGDADLSNDDDPDTYYASTATAQQAIQYDLLGSFQLSSIDFDVDAATVNFWLIGYAASAVPPLVSASLNDAVNTPGRVLLKSYAGPFSGGLYTEEGLTETVRYLRVQKADSSILKLQMKVNGTAVPNIPPVLLTPIADQVVTEGDPLTLDVRGNFNDANLDNLAYDAKILDDDGLPTIDVYDWLPFVTGVFNSHAAEYEGSTGTAKVVTVRVFASDGQAQVYDDFQLTVNKKATVPTGVTLLGVRIDKGNHTGTVLMALDAGTASAEIVGVDVVYNPGSKGMSTGAYSFDGKTFNRQAVNFQNIQDGKTYKAKVVTPNGPYEKQFTVPVGTTTVLLMLYPDSGTGTTASVTNVYIGDTARLASEKKATLRSEASELVQFQIRKTDGTIVVNFTDGALVSGIYQLISNIVLADGGYIMTSRIKSAPEIFKSDSFTVSTAVAQILKIGIAPTSIIDGICRSVRMYAQVTTGNIEEAWYAFPTDFLQMDAGAYPTDYNRSASAGGAANTGIEFETSREFKFRIKGTTDVIAVNYARNGDAVGVIRQVWPFRPADAPIQNTYIQADKATMDYRVRIADGKAYWRLVINRPSGFNLIYFDSTGLLHVNDTTEHAVEIGERITLYAFLTRSDDGLDLDLQDNGEPDPYGTWITRRPMVIMDTSTEKTN